MASYSDIDALVEWVGPEQSESLGPQSIHVKDAQTPTLLFPFAAPRSRATVGRRFALRDGDEGPAVGACSGWSAACRRSAPSTTSRRAARRAAGLAQPRNVRRRRRVRRGQGRVRRLRDPLARREVVGGAGQPGPRADRLDPRHRPDGSQRPDRRRRHRGRRHHLVDRGDGRRAAAPVRRGVQGRRGQQPIETDLTGGLGEADLDMAELAAKAREESPPRRPVTRTTKRRRAPSARCRPRRAATGRHRHRTGPTSTSSPRTWSSSSAPVRSGRTARRAPASRWRSTTTCPRPACSSWRGPPGSSSGRRTPTPAGTTSSRATWSTRPSSSSSTTSRSRWNVGIRQFVDDGAIDRQHLTAAGVGVPREGLRLRGVVRGRGRAFAEVDPEHTIIRPVPDSSDWQVIRQAGTQIRVPRRIKLSRFVGAQIPTGSTRRCGA